MTEPPQKKPKIQPKKGQPTNPHVRRKRRSITSFTMDEICHLRKLADAQENDPTVVALIYVHGSWNTDLSWKTALPKHQEIDRFSLLENLLSRSDSSSNVEEKDDDDKQHVIGALQVDQSEDTYACCIGDDHFTGAHSIQDVPIPPAQLPALAVAIQGPKQEHARVRYLKTIPPSQLLWYSVLQRNPHFQTKSAAFEGQKDKWSHTIQSTIQEVLEEIDHEGDVGGCQTSHNHDEKENDKKQNDDRVVV